MNLGETLCPVELRRGRGWAFKRSCWRGWWSRPRKRTRCQVLDPQRHPRPLTTALSWPKSGERSARTTIREMKVRNGAALDAASIARARLAGLKRGYVPSIPATVMPAAEVIGSTSCGTWSDPSRMSKTDLQAGRSITATRSHLTIVFAALCASSPPRRHRDEHQEDRRTRPIPTNPRQIAGHEHLAGPLHSSQPRSSRPWAFRSMTQPAGTTQGQAARSPAGVSSPPHTDRRRDRRSGAHSQVVRPGGPPGEPARASARCIQTSHRPRIIRI